MEFIKKHWEKILLGVVLIGLAVAVGILPLKIASDKQQLSDTRAEILDRKVKPLPNLDLSDAESTLARAGSRVELDFSTGHRLFNPVLWQKTTDGRPLKVQSGNEIGPAAVQATAIDPLYTIVSIDNILTNDLGASYLIGVERQAAPKLRDRRKQQNYASLVENKTDLFTLLKVQGPAEKPDALIFNVIGSDGEIRITPSEPFKRVDGYTADLKYGPESKTWLKRRVGDLLPFAGENYNIVAITKSEVVLSSPSGKKSTIAVARD
jgi:hypothetical protein